MDQLGATLVNIEYWILNDANSFPITLFKKQLCEWLNIEVIWIENTK